MSRDRMRLPAAAIIALLRNSRPVSGPLASDDFPSPPGAMSLQLPPSCLSKRFRRAAVEAHYELRQDIQRQRLAELENKHRL